MGLFIRLKKGIRAFLVPTNVNHEFQSWEKEKGTLISKIRALQRQIMDKNLMLMEKLLTTKNAENSEIELIKMIFSFINPTGQQELSAISTTNQKIPDPINEIEFTDEQINNFLNSNPYLVKRAKLLNEEQIRTQIINFIPNISKKSLEKIIVRVKE